MPNFRSGLGCLVSWCFHILPLIDEHRVDIGAKRIHQMVCCVWNGASWGFPVLVVFSQVITQGVVGIVMNNFFAYATVAIRTAEPFMPATRVLALKLVHPPRSSRLNHCHGRWKATFLTGAAHDLCWSQEKSAPSEHKTKMA